MERVGINDNYFELGGDSILGIQIISRARQAGLHLLPRQMFEHQTVASLAQAVNTVAAVVAEQGIVTGDSPLTAATAAAKEETEAGIYSTSNFPEAALSQAELDEIIAEYGRITEEA